MGLTEQLEVFASKFGVDAAWVSRLSGYNKARNCLAHRNGLVGDVDFTQGEGSLVIRWMESKVARAADHELPHDMAHLARFILTSGEPSYRGQLQDKERRFSAGQSVDLRPEELLQICATFQMATAALKVIKLIRHD
jgi:hypothetical protein